LGAGTISFFNVQTLVTQLLSYFRVVINPKSVFLTTEFITENTFSDTDGQDKLKEMVDDTLQIASKLYRY